MTVEGVMMGRSITALHARWKCPRHASARYSCQKRIQLETTSKRCYYGFLAIDCQQEW